MIKSEINLKIELGEDKIPEKIEWYASDSPMDKPEPCSAVLLSLWDGETKQDKNIQLWTKKMTIEEMNHFVFRNLMMVADSFERATNNTEEATKLKDFTREMGFRLKVLKKKTT